MYKQIPYSLILSLLIISCGSDNSSGPANENSSNSHSSEIPCNVTNEGTIIKPADSDVEHICKDGLWIAVEDDNSSSSANATLSSDSDVKYNSSSSSVIGSETDKSGSSSSSVVASETKQSSSSGYDNDDFSSSSEKTIESSSSEETKMFLCEDGETYVLDPANCEKVSSSSVVIVSSSSDNKPISSSSDDQESSSSEVSSSSVKTESSSSKVESCSSETNAASSSSLNSIYDAVNNTLTDLRDGQVYKTVTIGTQVWMAQNLNYLPNDSVGTVWTEKSSCGGGEWKNIVEGDCSIYGRLYEENFSIIDSLKNGLCPEGWSIPTISKFNRLIDFFGDDVEDKLKIADNDLWPNRKSTNESGFAALPSGYYHPSKGFDYKESENAVIASFAIAAKWSADKNVLEIRDVGSYNYSSYGNRLYMAVRCIKN